MQFSALAAYGFEKDNYVVMPFGSGLINKTWKVEYAGNNYILQRVNENVFTEPAKIASNILLLSEYINHTHPGYFFVAPVTTKKGEQLVATPEGYFRLFPFIHNSYTYNVVNTPAHAYEAAQQFGRFTKMFSGFDATLLNETIPDFHNLSLRFQQFENAIMHGNAARIAEAAESIDFIRSQKSIVAVFEKIKTDRQFKLRVTHHDTKISNVLFNEEGKGIAVIDLDTVMPGYFINDIGDMMRTCLSPVSEEEKDFSKIKIRDEYFEAIVTGYLHEMNEELTPVEKKYFVYAGKFLIYMQAIRFLTDYFNDDIYYGSKYPAQNLIRANNQLVLLQKLLQKEEQLEKMVL